MQVFLSWSGEKSKQTAICLKGWIRKVIQATDPWISSDIQKGARWNDEIKKGLEKCKIGIICINKENITSEWILFEAGALSKTEDAHVCTFLLDINPANIQPPLGQFQATQFNKDDIRSLIHTINKKVASTGGNALDEKELNEIFDTYYPELNKRLSDIQDQKPVDDVVKRTEREILEEILQTVRANNKYHDYNNLDPFIGNNDTYTKLYLQLTRNPEFMNWFLIRAKENLINMFKDESERDNKLGDEK